MTNLIALALFTALVLGVIAALQHNHRRMAGYGAVPFGGVSFGFDSEDAGDRDGIRAVHDLDAIAAHDAGLDPIAVSSTAVRRG